jgi:hypothetical protein
MKLDALDSMLSAVPMRVNTRSKGLAGSGREAVRRRLTQAMVAATPPQRAPCSRPSPAPQPPPPTPHPHVMDMKLAGMPA